jgi:hypothetical protein
MVSFGDIIGWTRIVAWLVDHGLLAAAAAHPLVPLPGTGGAGLDVPRLAVLAAAVFVWVLLVADSRDRRRRIPPHQYG